ncbi:hypothetical protein NE237_027369 [Protea cynaroides]|uniref:Uncharacterized protein n=1 Tax=Protea cynaroides TaxID=273540 RepID=A0A9Q0JT42_9MAGN|nr:hypothetical protein NE237_027369 [Protea cynaroides]
MDVDNLGDSKSSDGKQVAMEPSEIRDEPAGVDEPIDSAGMECSGMKRPAIGTSKGAKKAWVGKMTVARSPPIGRTTEVASGTNHPQGSDDVVEIQPPTSRLPSMDSREEEGATLRSQSETHLDLPLYSESLTRREEILVSGSKRVRASPMRLSSGGPSETRRPRGPPTRHYPSPGGPYWPHW